MLFIGCFTRFKSQRIKYRRGEVLGLRKFRLGFRALGVFWSRAFTARFCPGSTERWPTFKQVGAHLLGHGSDKHPSSRRSVEVPDGSLKAADASRAFWGLLLEIGTDALKSEMGVVMPPKLSYAGLMYDL